MKITQDTRVSIPKPEKVYNYLIEKQQQQRTKSSKNIHVAVRFHRIVINYKTSTNEKQLQFVSSSNGLE